MSPLISFFEVLALMNILTTHIYCVLSLAVVGLCSACDNPESDSTTLQDMRIELVEPDAISISLDDDQNINESVDLEDSGIAIDPEETLNQALEPSNRACLGPWMCSDAQGCHDGNCGVCTNSKECPQGFVCSVNSSDSESTLDTDEDLGQCQACDDDIEALSCEEGFSCMEGRCLEDRLQLFSVEVSEANWDLVRAERYESGLEVPCRVRVGFASRTLSEGEQPEESEEEDQTGGSDQTDEDNQTEENQDNDMGKSDEGLLEESLSEEILSCKLRVHGGSSRDLRKLSWRLILDERQELVSWGDKHVILRAEYNDLSVMRNVLSLQLFHDWTKIPVPRWRYVWFKVNGQNMGMFLNVERYTNRMIRNWGRDDTSPRYEADPNLLDNLLPGASAFVSLPDQQSYWSAYEIKAGSSYQPLIDFIENMIGDEARTEWNDSSMLRLAPQFQWGDYLRYLTIMTLVQNLDHIRKNFNISRQLDTQGQLRWEVYPWDLDLSWGCLYTEEYLSLCEELTYDSPIETGRILGGGPPTYPTDGLYNTLIERSLTPPLAISNYENLLCELTQDVEQNPTMSRIFTWQKALRSYLRPWVELDETSRHESSEDFDLAVDELNEFWNLRRNLIRSELDCP